jgi:hypothetical protein
MTGSFKSSDEGAPYKENVPTVVRTCDVCQHETATITVSAPAASVGTLSYIFAVCTRETQLCSYKEGETALRTDPHLNATYTKLSCKKVVTAADIVDLETQSKLTSSDLALSLNPPTTAPTKPAQTDTATPAQTPLPTPAPAKREKPVFDEQAESAAIAQLTTAATIADVTLPPTPAPTPYPTYAGFTIVEEQKQVQAVETSLKFDLTEAEANNPAMKKSITSGIIASLGLGADSVTILEINGVKLDRRRLANNLDVKVQITAPEAITGSSALDTLKADVLAAASEGSIIANIIKEAANNGVLVESLKKMTLAQTVTATTKAVTITVPTSTPTSTSPFSAAAVPAISSLALTLCLTAVIVMVN